MASTSFWTLRLNTGCASQAQDKHPPNICQPELPAYLEEEARCLSTSYITLIQRKQGWVGRKILVGILGIRMNRYCLWHECSEIKYHRLFVLKLHGPQGTAFFTLPRPGSFCPSGDMVVHFCPPCPLGLREIRKILFLWSWKHWNLNLWVFWLVTFSLFLGRCFISVTE